MTTIIFDKETEQKIEDLKDVLGERAKSKVIRKLIDIFHSKFFNKNNHGSNIL
jgi:hypothetical protein